MLCTVLFVCSLVSLLAGMWISAAPLGPGAASLPEEMGMLGLALLLQGAYTALLLLWASLSFARWSLRLLTALETVALLFGSLGLLQGILYNLNPRPATFEFGTLSLSTLLLAHAVVGLLYVRHREMRDPSLRLAIGS